MPKLFSVKASATEGKMLLGEDMVQDALVPDALTGITDVLPFQIPSVGSSFGSAFKKIGSGLKSVITGKNPKALIFAIVLALVWAFQFLIMELGGAGPIGKILEWFTFARGGYASNPFLIAGGVLGKCAVAAAFFSIIDGGLPNIISGARSAFSKNTFTGGNIGFVLAGAGAALCIYQIFAGYAALNDTMAAIAGIVLVLRAAGTQSGGIFGIIRSLTAAKLPRTLPQMGQPYQQPRQNQLPNPSKKEMPSRISAVLAGAATGFALAIPLSAIPFAWAPVIAGAIALIAGIILCLVSRSNGQTPMPAMMALLLAVLLAVPSTMMIPMSASASIDEDNRDERSGEIYQVLDSRRDPYSKAVLNYEIKGGTDFQFGWDPNWAKWSGSVFAKPGETITVSYSTEGFSTPDRLNESVQFYHDLKSYDVDTKAWEKVYYYPAEGDYERTFIEDETKDISNSSPSTSGTVTFTVPSYEQIKKDGVGYELKHGNYKFSIDVGQSQTVTSKSDPSKVYGTTLRFDIDVFVEKNDDESTTVVASPFSGDMKVNIPLTIVRDLLAAAAAFAGAGAAAAASGSSSRSKTARRREDDPVVGYQMYATKSFGDGIRKGARAVEVQCRIEQVCKSGKHEVVPGQAYNMEAKGTHLKVTYEVGGSGLFLRAFVSADANEKSDEGTLSFIYTREASFTCNIIFKLTGVPKVTFPQVRQENGEPVLDIIGGDGLLYAPLMVFEDAIGEPNVLRFRAPDDLVVRTCETDPSTTKVYPGVVYHALVYNRTNVLAEDQIVSRSLPRRMIGVHAEFENGDVLEGKLLVKVFPEGLSVESEGAYDGKLIVPTAPLPSAPPDSLKPTVFSVNVAIPDPDVARTHFRGKGEVPDGLTELSIVPPDIAGIEFGELGKVEDYGEMFKTNFDYEIALQRAHLQGEGAYEFAPKNALPQPDDPYEGETLLSCFYRGQRMELFLPLEFTGDNPDVPHEWEAEVEKLRRTVAFYGLNNNMYARNFIHHIRSHTPNEISMFRYEVIREARDFYYEQSRALLGAGNTLAIIENGAAFFEWAGDQAFTILVYYWVGTHISPKAAPYVDAVVSPMKQVWTHMVGSYLGALWAGELGSFSDDEIFASVGTIAQNVLVEVIEASVKDSFSASAPANIKKLGALVAGYLMISFTKHYMYGDGNEKGDVYKSLIAAGCDLSTAFLSKVIGNSFKALVGQTETISKLYNMKSLTKGITNSGVPFLDKLAIWFAKTLESSDKFFKAVPDLKTADVIENYLTATWGFVGTKVTELHVDSNTMKYEYGCLYIEFYGNVLSIPIERNLEAFGKMFVTENLYEFTSLNKRGQMGEIPDYMVQRKQAISGNYVPRRIDM